MSPMTLPPLNELLSRTSPKNVVYCAVFLVGLLFISFLRKRFGSSVRKLPGPASSSLIYGNLPELYLARNYGDYEYKWQAQFGDVYPINGCMGEKRLLVSDHAALKYIFSNATTFVRSASFRRIAWVLTGEGGLFHVDEDEHRRLRSVMNLAFAPTHIRGLVPLFQDISRKVIERLRTTCESQVSTGDAIDIYNLLQNATLDTVSQGAIGYDLNAMDEGITSDFVQAQYNALALASNRSQMSLMADSIIEYLPQFAVRMALFFPTEGCRALRRFRDHCRRLMDDLVGKKMEASRIGEKGKDILSVMIDINTQVQASSKLHDIDLCNQSRSLLIAGQETTGGFLCWALYELAKHPDWQEQIRAELLECRQQSGGELTRVDVESAVYLNAHLKETMRMYPGVPIIDRVATENLVIPLSTPVTTKDGSKLSELALAKGQMIHCMISSYNKSTTLWGPDGGEFTPKRWLQRNNSMQGRALGPYANVLSFLSGPFTCIGWRFAIMQIQVILAALICKFEFEISDVLIRPNIATTLLPVSADGLPHLPLIVRVVQ